MAIYNQTYNINNQCGMGNMNFGQGLLYGMLGSLTGMVGGGSYMGMNGSLFNMPGLGNMYGSPASFFGMGGYGCCGGMSGYSDSYYASMAGMSVANVVLGGVFSAIGAYRTERAESKAAVDTAKSDVKVLEAEMKAIDEENAALNVDKMFNDSNGKIANSKVSTILPTEATAYNSALEANTTAQNALSAFGEYKFNGQMVHIDSNTLTEIKLLNPQITIDGNNITLASTDAKYTEVAKSISACNTKYTTKKNEADTAKTKLNEAKTNLVEAAAQKIKDNDAEKINKQAKLDEAQEIIDSAKTNKTTSAKSWAKAENKRIQEEAKAQTNKSNNAESNEEAPKENKNSVRNEFMVAYNNYKQNKNDTNKSKLTEAYNKLNFNGWATSDMTEIYKNIIKG